MRSRAEFIDAAQRASDESRAGLDPDHPRFHVAPPVGRLNDPNGLVVIDGVYHVFYQFGPFFPGRKAVYWGHASSTDLLDWQHHPPAIAPADWYDRNGVYSGGAVVHGGQVWLHYTGNVKDEQGRRQAYQCAVTTTDLETFAKLDANPLIAGPPAGYTAHLRDPYVVPDAAGFAMYLGAQRADNTGCILVYRSTDLVGWELAGELTFPDDRYADFGYMWECPNLLRLPDAATGEEYDVLIFCPQGIEPAGDQFRNIFACGYLVGRLDGTRFTPVGEFTELDAGFEFYAPQVFTVAPGEPAQPPLLVGWLGNASEDRQPSLADHGWVHTLTVPRDLTLRNGRLHQLPRRLAGEPRALAVAGTELAGGSRPIPELDGVRSFLLDLVVERATDWQLTLGRPDGSRVVLSFQPGALTVDRTATRYPHGGTRRLAIPAGDRLSLTVVHDRSATELFLADGHTAFSLRSYLDPDGFQVTLGGDARIAAATATVIG
ncbi:MAG: glycoside hydrolase family 32 protein [Propionicimonas sp.]